MKRLIQLFSFVILLGMVASCSSLRQAKLDAGNDRQKAIAEVTQVMQAAQKDQIDVLADAQYQKGTVYLDDAKRYFKQDSSSESVLENAAIAKALFQDARKTADGRKAMASRILVDRGAALSAGVRQSGPLVEMLMDIDNDLKSETKQFSRALSPEDFSAFQKKYLALETKAVQFSQLSGSRAAIDNAIENDSDDLAPKTLNTAQLDYEAAMNMIAQSPRSPNIFKSSVETAQASATQLVDVMDVIMGAPGTPENIALQIVKQKRALGELTTNVGKLEANLQTTQKSLQQKESELQQKADVLKSQEEQLALASTQVRFQQAMDEARQQILPEDALVYQQGNTLVFRLKRINFASGAAVIPETSKSLITKVDSIIKKLEAEKVIVQGHTDSIGSDSVNKKLSTERAAAVANYLYSLGSGYKLQYIGYGETHPIASNETAAGRATNRRVDLVVSVRE